MKKISRQRSEHPRLHAEAGQATLEYILILVITTMIILTAVWQFNTAFRKYADQFFDGYIACLLETGELPSSGGECSAEFNAFKLADGKSLGGGITGGGGSGSTSGGSGKSDGSKSGSGSGSGGSGSKSANTDTKNKSSSGDSGSSGGGGEVGGSGGSGSGGSAFGSGGRGRQRSTQVTNAKSKGSDGKGREPLTAIGNVDQGSSRDSLGRARKVALNRSYGYAGQEDDANKALTSAVAPVAKDDSNHLKAKKVAVDMTRKPASTADKDDQGFSFGNMLRIMIIAGIIIAMLILFGGQILQIVKSSEK